MRFKSTGDLIKKKLKEKKAKDPSYSGVWLGKQLGVTSQFISNWQRGVSSPPMYQVKAVCLLLDISKKEYEGAWISHCKKELRDAFK